MPIISRGFGLVNDYLAGYGKKRQKKFQPDIVTGLQRECNWGNLSILTGIECYRVSAKCMAKAQTTAIKRLSCLLLKARELVCNAHPDAVCIPGVIGA